MPGKVEAFHAYRAKMNERILATGNLETKRFWALDDRVYKDGALPAKTKELLGLVASTDSPQCAPTRSRPTGPPPRSPARCRSS